MYCIMAYYCIIVYVCRGSPGLADAVGVCEKTLLRKVINLGILAFRAPNRGLESSFCRWVAGQGLAEKGYFDHKRRYQNSEFYKSTGPYCWSSTHNIIELILVNMVNID